MMLVNRKTEIRCFLSLQIKLQLLTAVIWIVSANITADAASKTNKSQTTVTLSAKWTYKDQHKWSSMYPSCGSKHQSPIDIKSSERTEYSKKKLSIELLNYDSPLLCSIKRTESGVVKFITIFGADKATSATNSSKKKISGSASLDASLKENLSSKKKKKIKVIVKDNRKNKTAPLPPIKIDTKSLKRALGPKHEQALESASYVSPDSKARGLFSSSSVSSSSSSSPSSLSSSSSSSSVPAVKASWLEGDQFELREMHFHLGTGDEDSSEHLIDGKSFAGEIQFVHSKKGTSGTSNTNSMLVLAVLLEKTDDKETADCDFKSAITALTEKHSSIKLESIHPWLGHRNVDEFYHYNGSSTIPPCNEGVVWVVLAKPVKVHSEELEALRGEIVSSHGISIVRKPQPLNDREVVFSYETVEEKVEEGDEKEEAQQEEEPTEEKEEDAQGEKAEKGDESVQKEKEKEEEESEPEPEVEEEGQKYEEQEQENEPEGDEELELSKEEEEEEAYTKGDANNPDSVKEDDNLDSDVMESDGSYDDEYEGMGKDPYANGPIKVDTKLVEQLERLEKSIEQMASGVDKLKSQENFGNNYNKAHANYNQAPYETKTPSTYQSGGLSPVYTTPGAPYSAPSYSSYLQPATQTKVYGGSQPAAIAPTYGEKSNGYANTYATPSTYGGGYSNNMPGYRGGVSVVKSTY